MAFLTAENLETKDKHCHKQPATPAPLIPGTSKLTGGVRFIAQCRRSFTGSELSENCRWCSILTWSLG
eukprot:3564640-Rhodomonas_salina.4